MHSYFTNGLVLTSNIIPSTHTCAILIFFQNLKKLHTPFSCHPVIIHSWEGGTKKIKGKKIVDVINVSDVLTGRFDQTSRQQIFKTVSWTLLFWKKKRETKSFITENLSPRKRYSFEYDKIEIFRGASFIRWRLPGYNKHAPLNSSTSIRESQFKMIAYQSHL